MNLLECAWLPGQLQDGRRHALAAAQIGDSAYVDLTPPRADFRGALYQFLIGLLQTACAPQDLDEWRQRYANPPSADELTAAFAPFRQAFVLVSDAAAFMQDLALPDEVNRLPVLELLIDAGSSSNLFFNKPAQDHGLCEACCAQALLTLQLNAPSGGRGIRTSLRGGGPLTTLLLPEDRQATLWRKLWLNVLPQDALAHPPVRALGDVLPWLLPTRTSDGKDSQDTPPEAVHPLQAYWSMPRRIRLEAAAADGGVCSLCGAADVRRIHHYRTRHGGTNYTGGWLHPLTPYYLDAKGGKPPISAKGRQAGTGYRDWLGLVLGSEDHRPDAARAVMHFNAKRGAPAVRLWCFGYDMSNMKARCWYDSTLPVHRIAPDLRRVFIRQVKWVLDSASEMEDVLHAQVKAAWFRRPGEVKPEPAVKQSFWQGSEPHFYRLLASLSRLDFDREAELAQVYRFWLLDTRRLVLGLFDQWVLSGPLEDLDMRRMVQARADLVKKLAGGKALKTLWELVNRHYKEARHAATTIQAE